jgi:hypothetical protein
MAQENDKTHGILIDDPGVVVGSLHAIDPVELAPDANALFLPNPLEVDTTS